MFSWRTRTGLVLRTVSCAEGRKRAVWRFHRRLAKAFHRQILSISREYSFSIFSCGLLNLKLESYPPYPDFLAGLPPTKLCLSRPPESAVPPLSTKNSRLPWRWDAKQDGRRAVGPRLAACFF